MIKYNLHTVRDVRHKRFDRLNKGCSKYDIYLPQIVELAKQEISFSKIAQQLNIPQYVFWKNEFRNKIIDLANKEPINKEEIFAVPTLQ